MKISKYNFYVRYSNSDFNIYPHRLTEYNFLFLIQKNTAKYIIIDIPCLLHEIKKVNINGDYIVLKSNDNSSFSNTKYNIDIEKCRFVHVKDEQVSFFVSKAIQADSKKELSYLMKNNINSQKEKNGTRTNEAHIDPYLFEKQLEAFKIFVEEKSNIKFVSFSSNPYTEDQEGYKYTIHRLAREALIFQAWKQEDIGSGDIITSTIEAIEIPKSNLVPWKARYGEKARPQQPLYEAKKDKEKKFKIEQCLHKLYFGSEPESSFNDLIGIFGKKYPLISYLFFLKDKSKYLPLAPNYFDKSFEILGANFKTSKNCSWENYSKYVNLIAELKEMLSSTLNTEVTLIDAHSFAWMLSAQMEKENKLADVKEYSDLSQTERDSIIKARIGQGQFRNTLINYWSECAVTGCAKIPLLRASHIKPWSKSSVSERLNLYNGLLLSPTLDTCFDAGYISFSDDGKIIISKELSTSDLTSLGINKQMVIEKLKKEHTKFLDYHRKFILKKTS